MNNQPQIIFVLGSLSQPRILKRINSFIDNGFDIKVYAFDRGVYNINTQNITFQVNHLGTQRDGTDYFAKLLQYYRLHRRLGKEYINQDVIFYFFGFAEAFFTLFGNLKYIYEISDILYAYPKFKFIAPILKFVDKRLIKNSLITVMTSGGFKTYLYGDKKLENIIIQPNKLNPIFSRQQRDQLVFSCNDSNKITFSYIGAFRYPNTVFRFAEVIGRKYPNHKFKFHGDSIYTKEVQKLANRYINIEYCGPFKNPDDLLDIYNEIDFVVACYDPSGLNERIAEPNKMYEAIYFKKPIVVTEKTYLAKQVNDYGCGFTIDATNDDNIISFINSITSTKLSEVKKSIEMVPTATLIDDNATLIVNKLRKLL